MDEKCRGCNYYDKVIKDCNDTEIFVDKRNTLLLICRKDKNAININDVEDKK